MDYERAAGVRLIVGARGSGKSTLGRWLIKGERRVIVFDPTRDWVRNGAFREVRTLRELAGAMQAGWWQGFRLCFPEGTGDPPAYGNALAKMILQAQERYFRGEDPREVVFVIEELAAVFGNAEQNRRDLGDMRRLLLQGRHYGVHVLAITQRPQDCATMLRDQIDAVYALRLPTERTKAYVLDLMGREHAGALTRLGPHEFLASERGVVTKGRAGA